MAAITVDCHDLALRGLKDPYTGEVMTFKMVLGNGAPRVYSDNAFSPTAEYDSSEKAFLAIHTRDGMAGAIADHEPVLCPYSGVPMRLVASEGSYRWVGGFDPTLPIYEAPDFINRVRQRNGELVGEPRHSVGFARVSEANVDIPTDVNVDGVQLTADSEDAIRKIVDGPAKVKKTVVAVNGRKKQKAQQ